MQKLGLSLVAVLVLSTFGYSNTISIEDTKTNNFLTEKTSKTNVSETTVDDKIIAENEAVCSVSCTITIGDVQYYTSAGNWFTSCATAASRCEAKLAQLLQ